jgi:hypothetical protein
VTRVTEASEKLPPCTALLPVKMKLLCTNGGTVFHGGDGAVRRRVACCRFTDICERRNASLFG